jgi:hypothetical protein
VLVRPDGHVAWRGDEAPTDATTVIDRVRGAADLGTPMPEGSRAAHPQRAHLL